MLYVYEKSLSLNQELSLKFVVFWNEKSNYSACILDKRLSAGICKKLGNNEEKN